MYCYTVISWIQTCAYIKVLVLRCKIFLPDFSVSPSNRHAENDCDNPSESNDGPAVGLSPPSHGLDGENDGQESIQRHKDQSVNAHVGCGDDQELN